MCKIDWGPVWGHLGLSLLPPLDRAAGPSRFRLIWWPVFSECQSLDELDAVLERCSQIRLKGSGCHQ